MSKDTPDTAWGALDVTGLSVAVGDQQILRDVRFSIPAGGSLALVGESGAGKTMVCRALTGRLARIGARGQGGSVSFDGTDLLAQSPKQWRRLYGRRIALVPQNSLLSLDPVMRVGRQLDETLRELDPSAPRQARAVELLDMVHLAGPRQVLRAYPHELSGGMRQRVMIALALAGKPDLLVADEPTSALDVTVQHGILGLLAELRTLTRMSIVFVTHDLSIVERVCDQVAVMYAGSVVESGPAATMLTAPRHPYTRALVAAHPATDRPAGRLAAIPGQPRSLVAGEPGCQFAPRCPQASGPCHTEVPALAPDRPGTSLACWHPQDGPP
jgi:oligopeptide/dipeptide ABC transporter ATP-binding protein